LTAAVDLESDGYSGTYKLIGQSVSLDFANLVSYRDTPKQHDWLKPESNLDVWRAEVGLDANGQDCEHVSVVSFRETLAQVFLAAADGAVPAQSDLDVGECTSRHGVGPITSAYVVATTDGNGVGNRRSLHVWHPGP
jgi:hypothetical protein